MLFSYYSTYLFTSSWLIDGDWLQQVQTNPRVNLLFTSITQHPSIFHIFKSAGGDTLVSQYSFPFIPALLQYNHLVDLDVMGRSICFTHLVALSLLVFMIWGKPLNKSQQCTDWSLRPLTQSQTHYAATDAFVSRAVFLKFWEIIERGEIPKEMIENLEKSSEVFPPLYIDHVAVPNYDLTVKVGAFYGMTGESLQAAKQCRDYNAKTRD